ncbi:N-acetylneuraminate synthase [Galenea microaerophila]
MSQTFIIAEAGVNHNGELRQAIKLVDIAVAAGADAVKFQTFKADKLVTENAQQADYQTENTGTEQSQYALLKQLELSEIDHKMVLNYCQQEGIEFMSTPFDSESIEFLHHLGVQRWKIPSGELLSIPYLQQIAQFNQPTYLSTGMATLEEVGLAVETLFQAGLARENLTLLHANSAYPTPYQDVNLRAMQTLQKQFGLPVGLSDHSLGIEVPIAAVAMGASVIEKHFTLDRQLPGPDHQASLEADELQQMVQSIRHIEQALGSGEKAPTDSEKANIAIVRKRMVASQPIAEGEILTAENVTLKRSDNGFYADVWCEVIGQPAPRAFTEGEGIQW